MMPDVDLADIIVIVLIGGPGAGKSAVILDLQERYAGQAIFVPEAATDLMNARGLTPPFFGEDLRQFERDVTLLQWEREEAAKLACIERGLRFVICDRGTCDHPGYLPGGWSEYEELMGTTRSREYARYHLPLFLEMPSRDVYESIRLNNGKRHETYAQAFERARCLEMGWAPHPNIRRFGATDHWYQKRNLIRRTIAQFIDTRFA